MSNGICKLHRSNRSISFAGEKDQNGSVCLERERGGGGDFKAVKHGKLGAHSSSFNAHCVVCKNKFTDRELVL